MKKLWRFLNIPQVMLAHLAFWATVDLLQWGFYESLSKAEWASWVQAVGSVLAITFAFLIGQQQASATLQSVRDADALSAFRKFDSVLAVADEAQNYAKEVSKSFSQAHAHYLLLRITHSDQRIQIRLDALQAIPAHELGSYRAVSSFLALKNAVVDFHTAVTRAMRDFESSRPASGGILPTIEFDRTPIDLSLQTIANSIEVLHTERARLSNRVI